MTHKRCKVVGRNLEGVRYVFTLHLKDGSTEKVTLEPSGSATEVWEKSFFGKIQEKGLDYFRYTDSDPEKLVKTINNGGFILCDSGKGINGHQVIMEKMECVSEPYIAPLVITREQQFTDDFCC